MPLRIACQKRIRLQKVGDAARVLMTEGFEMRCLPRTEVKTTSRSFQFARNDNGTHARFARGADACVRPIHNQIRDPFALFRSRGMVVDNFPAVGEFAKDKREEAVRSFAVGHGEVIFAADESGVGAEWLDTEICKFQFSHVVPGTGVGGAIVVEGLLPSVIFVATGKEGQIRRIPVSAHEGD